MNVRAIIARTLYDFANSSFAAVIVAPGLFFLISFALL